MNLNQVTLPARDVGESVDFYRRLGFRQIVDSPHYARFECPEGDSTFSVHASEEGGDHSGVVVYFENDRLDELCANLRKNGVRFLQMPQDERWLWREARLVDPSGNTVCLYQAGGNRRHPPWRIDAD